MTIKKIDNSLFLISTSGGHEGESLEYLYYPQQNKIVDIYEDIINQNKSFQGGYFIGDTVNDGLSANLNQLPFIKAYYGYGRDQDWSMVITYQEINQFIELLELEKRYAK